MSATIEANFKCDLPCNNWGDQAECPMTELDFQGEEVVCSVCSWNIYANPNQDPLPEGLNIDD